MKCTCRTFIAPDGLNELSAILLTIQNRLCRYYQDAYASTESEFVQAQALLDLAKESRYLEEPENNAIT